VLTKGYPIEFTTYFQYCRALRFDDKPDYSYMRKVFRDLFTREGYHWDYVFDWTVLKHVHNQNLQRQVAPARPDNADPQQQQQQQQQQQPPAQQQQQRLGMGQTDEWGQAAGEQSSRRRLLAPAAIAGQPGGPPPQRY